MRELLFGLINLAYYALLILIFARIILSFVNVGSYQVRETIFRLTEPILAPVRRILPPASGLDFSPLIVLLAAGLIRNLLFSLVL